MVDKRSNSALTSADCMRIDDAHGVNNYKRKGFVPARAKGAYLYTPEGVQVFDGLAGYGSVIDHCWDVPIDALIKCLTDPATQLDSVSAVVATPQRAMMQIAMSNFTGYKRVFLKSSGGEIVETAYSTLFKHATLRGIPQEDQKIVLIENFFHGRMRSSQTNSSDPTQYEGKGPRVPGFMRVPRDVGAVRQALISQNVIGIVLEKHQGEAGPILDGRGKDSFYAAVHTTARECSKLVVVDDVQAGMYRCGYKMSWMEDGEAYRPDATLFGKIIGGGIMPVSAMVSNDEFMRVITPGTDGSTFGAFPPACAVVTAVLEYMEQNPWLGTRAIEVGKRFTDNLSGIPRVSVDYRGAMISVFVHGLSSSDEACHKMLKAKHSAYVLLGHANEKGAYIRLSPAYKACTDQDIDEICAHTIRPVLEETSSKLSSKG
ncbi:MAG: aminotransferase class III-fold pyridoxal phosphate-dependent enzyme [bacterium]|nr:aminotransferase class III-fold pyridoxal phosphate-dependent enzyme [bacterium]